MKTTLSSLLLGAAFCVAAAKAQNVGDTVTPEALGQAEWVQGSAPAEWEPGKLYVLECWATWCGPCIAAIPHVDALYDQYKDQGLRVIGMDVWEDGKDKVVDFVQKKGEGMSYPVAYTGKGGAFEEKWLKPAGVAGIPHAFLVKDGKVIAMTHPAQLTEETVKTLLTGGDDEAALLKKLNEGAAKQKAVAIAKGAWSAALAKKDPVAMAAAAEQLAEVEPGSMYVPLMRNEALIAAQNWAGVEKALADSVTQGPMRQLIVNSIANSVTKTSDVPAETLTKVISSYEEALAAAQKKGPMDAVILSRLYWKAGDKDKATAQAKEGAELVKTAAAQFPVPAEPFEKFAAAVSAGAMPADTEFYGWMKEAQEAKAAAAGEEKPAAGH